MFPTAQSSLHQQLREYDSVPLSEEASDAAALLREDEKVSRATSRRPWWRATWCAAVLVGVGLVVGAVLVFAMGYASGQYQHEQQDHAEEAAAAATHSNGECTKPYYRREWRTLSDAEKQDYIDAFQCFIEAPSELGMNGTLYDDFAWVHNLVAHGTHTKAPFLTWHRRFIWVYEQRLRKTCGYKGALPYWDWSLDWENLTGSPIFDSKLGFGSDGDPEAPIHRTAHCVTDTPFKKLEPQWYGSEYSPHCLTRWFYDDWVEHFLNPESIEEILASDTYSKFFIALEMGPHDIIPGDLRGDFTTFTAPNDPIFYLHHSQLDRIWWLWQSRDKENRVKSYDGKADGGADVTLSDLLPLAGLDKDLTVAEIMDTESNGMCYRYMYI
ncbi:hypothetical protein S40288_05207 [Stachybotrys chartarum IBT 40288]|nr:hypothetical protein S40288_05207 [Stachybotrys chartarum IBT 40288]